MKIFSLCCVRDENDIIRETLESALEWSDKIFIFDNGSVDRTWETLKDLAGQRNALILVGHEQREYSDTFRGEMFEANRAIASPGDWWCVLDADEIYIDNPKTFLANVPDKYDFIYAAIYHYYFTDVDEAAYNHNRSNWLSRSVQERLRHYQNIWSEPRFVRHRNQLRWQGRVWPPNRGLTFPARIRLKHYQYRSPEQIKRRLAIRQQQVELFPHEAGRSLCTPKAATSDWSYQWMKDVVFEPADWKDRVRPASECDVDHGSGELISRDELMPPLPSPLIDRTRVCLQSTAIGQALVWPLIKWWRKRSKPQLRHQ